MQKTSGLAHQHLHDAMRIQLLLLILLAAAVAAHNVSLFMTMGTLMQDIVFSEYILNDGRADMIQNNPLVKNYERLVRRVLSLPK